MRIIKFMIIVLLGVCLGFGLAIQIYQPLKLAQENEELHADVKALSKAYTREFSRIFIKPFHNMESTKSIELTEVAHAIP